MKIAFSKTTFAAFVFVNAIAVPFAAEVFAQASLAERAFDERHELNCQDSMDCKTAGVAAAATGVSTTMAVKKYAQARKLEAVHSKTLLEASGGTQPDSFRAVSLMNTVQDGDKVVVHYQLSFQENRAFHIDKYEKMADHADSMADFHATQAVSAAIPKAVTHVDEVKDASGNVISRNVRVTYEADHAGVAHHTAQAAMQRSYSRDYRREANAVRSGEKQAPIYDFDEEIKDSAGNRQRAIGFVNERVARDGKIMKVTRLPAEIFTQVRKAVRVARGGVVGAALLGAVAAEEAVIGAGAKMIEESRGSSGWTPSSRNRATAR